MGLQMFILIYEVVSFSPNAKPIYHFKYFPYLTILLYNLKVPRPEQLVVEDESWEGWQAMHLLVQSKAGGTRML